MTASSNLRRSFFDAHRLAMKLGTEANALNIRVQKGGGMSEQAKEAQKSRRITADRQEQTSYVVPKKMLEHRHGQRAAKLLRLLSANRHPQ